MSESSSSEKEDEQFLAYIKLFKQMCDNYEKKDDNFKLEIMLDSFKNIYLYLDKTKKSKRYKILLKESWHKSIKTVMKSFFDRNCLDLFDGVCYFVINITDKSEAVCESLAKVGLADVLIEGLIRFHDEKQSVHDTDINMSILSLVNNIARHVNLQQYFLQHDQINRFKQLVLPLCSDPDEEMSILATFVLTWLVKEDEKDKRMLEEHSGIVTSIVRCIERSFESEDRRFSGFSIWELLLGLQALSTIDAIKTKLINSDGFITTLIGIITSLKPKEILTGIGSSSISSLKEVELSLGIIWNLSFIDSNRHLLQTKYNIETVVEPFTKSESKPIRHNAKGLLWNLRKEPNRSTAATSNKYDIFLSYSHAQKDLVSRIEKRLKTEYRVWIDKDNIKGSGLDDMASGIEWSRIFVMCVSNSYKQSQCCHSEANYAYRLEKPIIPLILEYKYKPDGWLGLIVSSEHYIDVSDSTKLADALVKLNGVIHHKLKNRKNSKTLIRASSNKQLLEPRLTVKHWNNGEVSRWLSTNNLVHIQPKFEGFDGEMLNAMVNMKVEAPQIYYKSLERKMKLTFPEILKFSSALSKLDS